MDGANNGLPRSGRAQLSPANPPPPPVRASLGPWRCCAPGRERTHCQHGMPSISKPRPAPHSRQLLILFTLLPPSFYFHAESTLYSDSPWLCRKSQGNRPVFISHSFMSSCICVLRRLFAHPTPPDPGPVGNCRSESRCDAEDARTPRRSRGDTPPALGQTLSRTHRASLLMSLFSSKIR